MKKTKKYIILVFVLLLISVFLGFLPLTKNAKDIKISNLRISEASPLEIPENFSNAEKIELFMNESSEFGMNYFDFNKIYSTSLQYEYCVLSFEIYNGTGKHISISSISSIDRKGVYVSKNISNVEKVLISPGNLDTISIVIYIDRSVFEDNEILDEITENIRINFVQSNSDSNLSLFIKEEIMSCFFAHTVSLEANNDNQTLEQS